MSNTRPANNLRHSFGVIAGTSIAVMIIFSLEVINWKFYPLPEGFTMEDMKHPEKAKVALSMMPDSAFISILLIYAIGSFLGGLIAALVAGRDRNWPSIVTGVILFGMALWNGIEMMQPIWFMAGCLACIPFAWYAYVCVRIK
jgi:hypothetical protein